MASKLLILSLLLLSTLCSSVNSSVVHIGMISKALSDNGYNAMALTLEMTLTTLIPSNSSSSAFTVFCPPDKAFFNSKYSQPPITLLQYHVVPSKLDSEAIQSSSSLLLGARVETLLHGHPLVVTTLPDSGKYSMNDVKITNWEIYNDGFMVVHGVEDFFDPAYQTLRYPWYDGSEVDTKGGSTTTDLGEEDTSGSSSSSWVMKNSSLLLILTAVAISGVCLWLVLQLILLCSRRCYRRADGYIYIE